MAVLRIHTIPGDEELLRKRCAEVKEFGRDLKAIAADMLETLPVAQGIGLAAPQVGHSIRMVLIDISHGGTPEKPAPRLFPGASPPDPHLAASGEAAFFLVNPVIVSGEGSAMLAEGCLSVPGVRVEVPRKANIKVEAQDLDGKKLAFDATGLLSIVVQHELDHLEGKLIPDYIALGCKSWRDGEQPEGREILD